MRRRSTRLSNTGNNQSTTNQQQASTSTSTSTSSGNDDDTRTSAQPSKRRRVDSTDNKPLTRSAKAKGKRKAVSPSPEPVQSTSRPSKKQKTTATSTRTLRPRQSGKTSTMGRKRQSARAKADDDQPTFDFDQEEEQQPQSSTSRVKNRFVQQPEQDDNNDEDMDEAAINQDSQDESDQHVDSEDDDDDDEDEEMDQDDEDDIEMALRMRGDGVEDEDDEDHDSEILDAPSTVDADGSPLDRETVGELASGLRALQGIMSGMSNRLKNILAGLRSKDVDATTKLMTLQDLAEILSVGTEDTLAGFFQTEAFTKELVSILKGDSFGGASASGGADEDSGMSAEEAIAFGLDPIEAGVPFGGDEESNVQMMLLACRCLANMMEALPGSTHSVVYNGAVPILCSKLKEIQYIDLAEQTMSTLEKISQEMPSSIVREGGLSALLQYLDFFSFHVQRTAVTAAANCCRSLSQDSFDKISEVMPTFRNVLSYPDQRVVEQGCLAVVRIVDSYRHYPTKLESLVDSQLLSSVKSLLNPDATTLGQRTYTQLLKMLSTASRASPVVSITIIELGFGDTIYHILTGVPPPELGADGQPTQMNDKAVDEDDALVMQNLVQRPRDQIQETLNLVSELLPPLPKNEMFDSRTYLKDRSGKAKAKAEPEDGSLLAASTSSAANTANSPNKSGRPSSSRSASSSAKPRDAAKEQAYEQRVAVFRDGSDERKQAVERFYNYMLPTLVEVYSASVQAQVRIKAVQGILKVVAAAEDETLQSVLQHVPMASFLSAILSSKDNQSALLTSALQLVELLLEKLPSMYHFLFRKEGVLHEVERLASRTLLVIQPSNKSSPARTPKEAASSSSSNVVTNPSGLSRALREHASAAPNASTADMQAADTVTLRARHVRDVFGQVDSDSAKRAESSLANVKRLVERLSDVIVGELDESQARQAVEQVVRLFDNESEGPLSSFEMLDSGFVQGLLRFATEASEKGVDVSKRRALLARAFMPQLDGKPNSPAFSLLVKRLQESLSRMEEFEVVLASTGPYEDSKRSASSMLSRQLRLRLVAEEGSDIPKSCSNLVVSIHAIATFQAFNDYLRPRILAASGGSSGGGGNGGASGTLSGLLAAFAAANGMSPPPDTVGSSSSVPSSFKAPSALASSKAEETTPSSTATASGEASSSKAAAAPRPERRRSTRLSKKLESQSLSSTPDAKKSSLEDTSVNQLNESTRAVLTGETGEGAEARDERPVSLEMEDGNKMVAHTPDGTRISTPQPGKSSQAAPVPKPRASYAAALKTEPTDFHLEFSMNGREIPLDTTIYGAVHKHEAQLPEHSRSLNMWQSIYTVRFKKVSGPATRSANQSREGQTSGSRGIALDRLPSSIPADGEQAQILQLLWLLHSINAEQSDAFDGANAGLPESAFVNNKITAKLNRQLEEPMIVASACLPDWAMDLPTVVPFLFPFETRYTFLQSTSFGYARLMQKWVGNGRSSSSSRDDNLGLLGRLQRQKVRISRERILESAFKVFDLYGSSRASLEVEFFDEVGSGLGPTLEFYALVSKEFSKRSLKLWRSDSNDESGYVFSKLGLFPAPLADFESEQGKRVLKTFRMLGSFVAKALMDSRIIDVHLSKAFARALIDELPRTINSIRSVDGGLAKSLAMFERYVTEREVDGATLEDLAIDFTLPGYDIELKSGGKDIQVTQENVREYIDLVIDWTVNKGISRQVDEFKAGFSAVFPIRDLQSFTPAEVVMMTSALDEDWTIENLMTSTKADHGYTMDSRAVKDVLSIMSEFSPVERRAFLSFITGSPRLPIGGFSALTPPLTIVRKDGGDSSLPSVMTCVNYIKLPDYSSREVLKQRFKTAVHEGAGGFHLS